jgi:uncharacterized protein YegJ (DUF2314 family)
MSKRGCILFLILFAGLVAAHAEARDLTGTQNVPQYDPLMMEATRKAKASLDGFLAKLANPPPGTEAYAVKIGIIDDGDTFRVISDDSIAGIEYFWLNSITRTADGFRARIANDPELAHNVRFGQEIGFKTSDIFDWIYFDNGKMQGNFSACPALLEGPKEQLEQFKQEYGIDCQ